MWALRRAANLTRTHSYRMGFCQGCYGKLDILSDRLEHGIGYHGHGCLITGSSLLPKIFSHDRSLSTKSFWVTRSLSSQAGAETSDTEDDLEDVFSELGTLTGTDRVDNNPGKEDAHEFVSGSYLSYDTSEEDSVDAVAPDFGLTDSEANSKGEKTSCQRLNSELFKVVVETPRQSFSRAMEKWVEEGNALGRTEIALVMLILRKRRYFWRALQLSEWLEASKRLDFVERDYASRLDLIAKVHGLIKAESYIEKIPESFRGEIIYRTLLANCVSAANVKKSEEVFNKIRDLGFPMTTFSCNQLLLLYKRLDRKKMGDVLLMMEKEDVKPSLFTYKLLIDHKGRSNDINGMEQILETMKAQDLEPDILIQAMVARFYINSGFSEKAGAILKEMEGDNIKENRSACNVLLLLYASLGKVDDVGRVWKVCEANPYIHECLAAIEAWGKLGRIEDAEEVFEKMLTRWKTLSSKYYNALLNVYANHKLLSKGKDLAKRMSDNGCNIGPVTWDALVKLYVGAGDVEKADSILQKAFQQNRIKPMFNSYIVVMEKYSKRGDVHNAEKLFHRLRQNGYTGRIRQYQLLLEAYINAKTPAYGFRERMKADNIFPDKTVAAQLVAVDAFRKTQISELLD